MNANREEIVCEGTTAPRLIGGNLNKGVIFSLALEGESSFQSAIGPGSHWREH